MSEHRLTGSFSKIRSPDAHIGQGGLELDRIATATRFLWSSRPEGTPYISSVGLPLPSSELPKCLVDS